MGWGFGAILFNLFFTLAAGATPSDGSDALVLFTNTCATDAWTQTALTEANAIKSVLEEIQKDPNCSSLSQESLNVSAITSYLNVLNEMKSSNLESVSRMAQEQALLSAMAYATKPQDVQALQEVLTRMSAQFNSVNEANRLAIRARAATQLVSATNDLVTQVIANEKCVMKKPGLLAGVGALVANVGAAVTAINPGLGLGVSAGGSMLSNLINFAHKKNLTRAIRKINDDVLKPQALMCVMESLTNDYCRAQEALAAIHWQQEHQLRNITTVNESLYGLNLLSRELPSFMKWLQTLKSSASAQNPIDAYRIQDFNQREATLNSSPQIAAGVLNQPAYTDQLAAATNLAEKWPVIRNIVSSLVNQLYFGSQGSNNSSSNPLFQKKTRNEAMFFLIGKSSVPVNSATQDNYSFESNFDPIRTHNEDIYVTIDQIRSQFELWFDSAKVDLDRERTTIHMPDLQGALEAAFDVTQDYRRDGLMTEPGKTLNDELVSPYQSLVNIIDYLERQLLTNPGQYESKYYLPNTLEILRTIRDDLDAIHQPKPGAGAKADKKFYEDILNGIYKLASLEYGTVFLQNRISKHIDNAIVRFITNPRNSSEVAPIVAQTLFSNHLTDVLIRNTKSGSLAGAEEDISNSTTISFSTFQDFVDTYQGEIHKVLEYLRDQEQIGAESGLGYARKRARICSLLTNLPAWPDAVPFELCEGTSYRLYRNVASAPSTPVLTWDDVQKPLDGRSCQYYKFKRDTIIFELRQRN